MSTSQSPALSGPEPITALLIQTGHADTLAQFNPGLHQLRLFKEAKSDEKIDLGFSGSKLLEKLLQVPGEVISREELIAYAWPERVVGQGSLNQQIYTLRQILGDEKDREIIQTLPRRGYLFNPECLIRKATPSQEAAPTYSAPTPIALTRPKYWHWALGATLLASSAVAISAFKNAPIENSFAPLTVSLLDQSHSTMLDELKPTLIRMSTLSTQPQTIALSKATGFYQLYCLKAEHSYTLSVHPKQLTHLTDQQLNECLQ